MGLGGGGIISLLGLGISIFGTLEGIQHAKEIADTQKDIVGWQEAENSIRRSAMELDGRRKELEIFRNFQKTRALATSAATNQGAGVTNNVSALYGGYGQLSGQAGTNLRGITSSVAFGEKIFDFDHAINEDRKKLAELGGNIAVAQGFANLGGSLMSAGPTIGRILNW